MFKPFATVLILITLSQLLGCAKLACLMGLGGNGDNYCGNKPPAEAPPIPDSSPPAGVPQDTGAVFFWVQPGYKCQWKTGESVDSYKDAIRLTAVGNFIQLGDRCSVGASAPLSQTDLDKGVGIIGYKEGIYQPGTEEPPK